MRAEPPNKLCSVLDEILNLIESVSEGFPSYSCSIFKFLILKLLCVCFFV